MKPTDFSTQTAPLAQGSSSASLASFCVCGAVLNVSVEEKETVCPECGRIYSSDHLFEAGQSIVEELASPSVEQGMRRLGHFEILSCIGRGGMGIVYEAVDISLERRVALKVIDDTKGHYDQRRLQALIREARAQARLNHPSIVHIYFIGFDGERPFLAMEHIEGTTLSGYLKSGPVPFPTMVEWGLQMAQALQHAARFDVIHGDVKPGNVLIRSDGRIKLSDFGLARQGSKVTTPNPLLTGTPYYLPPEAGQGKPVGVRGDIYSLGVTWFEMTFGRLPYRFKDPALPKIMEAHRTARVEFPEIWPSAVPFGWKRILQRMLAKNMDDRYADYDSLIADLVQLRPLQAPRAGRFARSLAEFIDLGLVMGMMALVHRALVVDPVAGLIAPTLDPARAAALGCLLVPLTLMATWTQADTTLGRRLLNLRVVDHHGLAPSASRLGIRTSFQLMPAWLAAAFLFFRTAPQPHAGKILLWMTLLWALDMAATLLSSHGRSLYDFLLRTRVALNTTGEEG